MKYKYNKTFEATLTEIAKKVFFLKTRKLPVTSDLFMNMHSITSSP